ncbi:MULTISPECIES: polysaccharide pyruvyl transferase family protein [Mesorhizobium]|uniref:Polysaccharide pyruvyl transferase family protein n=1 Tax=Mesorhizobium denitrificans TaxID=2294114 RepID=A0A371XFC8_9HYPH|nr:MULTISPECIES: polysaccharide pyruvyl transferase family protein [Mesorhizobium]RFC67893.1 hypothetical protein DY251_09940 [Mesorhizobium denitrificans]
MKLIYHSNPQKNFGDELNVDLWPRLAPDMFDETSRTGFLGIGTIVGRSFANVDHLHVFSSGVGYDSVVDWKMPRTIWCVRGPLSAKVLGADADAALTDGAILAPNVLGIDSRNVERKGVGLIPHWESELEGGWKEAATLADMELITPIDDPVNVFQAINRKSLILTESLHGAIVADALGVPWLAIGTSGNVSIFKWTDWAMSLGVKLRIYQVPAPSGRAISKFGRFRSASADPVIPDAEYAINHYRGPGEGGGGLSSLRSLSRSAKKTLLENQLCAQLLGFSPVAMAERLAAVAKQEPQLSEAGTRARLAERMLERFRALQTEQLESGSSPRYRDNASR